MNVARVERSGMDLGGAATGITDQDGVVYNEGGSVQIWFEVYIS